MGKPFPVTGGDEACHRCLVPVGTLRESARSTSGSSATKASRLLLGAQFVGGLGAEISQRVDTHATVLCDGRPSTASAGGGARAVDDRGRHSDHQRGVALDQRRPGDVERRPAVGHHPLRLQRGRRVGGHRAAQHRRRRRDQRPTSPPTHRARWSSVKPRSTAAQRPAGTGPRSPQRACSLSLLITPSRTNDKGLPAR